MISLGSTLRALRTDRSMTQKELAKESGVTHTIISRIENDKIEDPRLSTVSKLASGLGISVSQFLEESQAVEDERETVLSVLRDHKSVLENDFHVRTIGVFGSVARGDTSPDSDVDILVRYKDGHRDIFNHSRLESYLEDCLDRTVDLVMDREDPTGGHRRIRENIRGDLIDV